jgi:hypothetical protein
MGPPLLAALVGLHMQRDFPDPHAENMPPDGVHAGA